MSRFTEFTYVEIPSKFCDSFATTEDLVYERYEEGSGIFIITPKGTKTDFASIPWILQIFWKPYDAKWNKSAIMHDHLWTRARTLQEYQEGNEIFYESSLFTGTSEKVAKFAFVCLSISKYIYWLRKRLYS